MMSSGKPIRNTGSLPAVTRRAYRGGLARPPVSEPATRRDTNLSEHIAFRQSGFTRSSRTTDVQPGPPPWNLGDRASIGRPRPSDVGFRLQHLPATIHAGLEIDVVRTAQLARILVFDIGRGLEGVRGASHAPPRRRGLFPWHGHGVVFLELFVRRRQPAERRFRFGSRAYRGTRRATLGGRSRWMQGSSGSTADLAIRP